MGCDCIAYVEVKKELATWYWEPAGPRDVDGDLAQWFVPQNYRLFGLLAGVRDESVEPLSPPRGLPDDVSSEIEMAHRENQEDAHSASWFTLSELMRCGDVESDVIGALQKLYGDKGEGRRVRLVFWFKG